MESPAVPLSRSAVTCCMHQVLVNSDSMSIERELAKRVGATVQQQERWHFHWRTQMCRGLMDERGGLWVVHLRKHSLVHMENNWEKGVYLLENMQNNWFWVLYSGGIHSIYCLY